MPGAAATQGALTRVSRPDAIMLPHDGVGGCTPSPRNDRPASSMIAFPTASAVATITGVSALGRMCRHSTRARPAPSAVALSTNGRAASVRTSPCTSRAMVIHPVAPKTSTTNAALGGHRDASSRSSTTRGSASAKSVMPSSNSVSPPVAYPAAAPTATPTTTDSSTASRLTDSDTPPPRPRVRPRRRGISEQVSHHDEGGAHRRRRHDERIVAGLHPLDQHAAYAGPSEHRLHEHRAREEGGEGEAEECQHGDECVAER